VEPSKPIANGLRIKRTVSAAQQAVKGEWRVGDVMRVQLEMESNATQTWVVVRDGVPSGATILGRGLGRESQIAQKGQTSSGWAWPSYIERAAESYRAYYRWVPQGKWSVEYSVRLNNAGEFKLPPVRVEAMYAPDVFGEAPVERVMVKP
jgi:alpha-2-macroglobulin